MSTDVLAAPTIEARCHLCRAMLDGEVVEARGLQWCADLIECKCRSRLRLGVGYARSLAAKADDLRAEAFQTDKRAEHVRDNPPPLPDFDYLDWINSPEWATFATGQRLAARHNCEWCDAKTVVRLDVHHLHYDTFRRERPEDVLVVCPNPCHRELDRIRRAGKPAPVLVTVEPGPPPLRVVTRVDEAAA